MNLYISVYCEFKCNFILCLIINALTFLPMYSLLLMFFLCLSNKIGFIILIEKEFLHTCKTFIFFSIYNIN